MIALHVAQLPSSIRSGCPHMSSSTCITELLKLKILALTDRSSTPIGYFQSFHYHEISHASRVCDTKEKFQKFKLSIFQPLQNGGRVKNKYSSPLYQTQPNFVYIFCGPHEG